MNAKRIFPLSAIIISALSLQLIAQPEGLTLPAGFNPNNQLAWIPPGSFTMGSPASELWHEPAESPTTTVTLSEGFWIGKQEVTQAEYKKIMEILQRIDENVNPVPSHFSSKETLPVERVSWFDAMRYCMELTRHERAAGRLPDGYIYNLPTEAQWEYACRAGTTTPFAHGSTLDHTQANFNSEFPYGTNATAPPRDETTDSNEFPANPWGLYSMHGNVWEWCRDFYTDRLPGGSVVDPGGPETGHTRVFRGGSWIYKAHYCRSANRAHAAPHARDMDIGFRVVLVKLIEEEEEEEQ